MAGHNDWASGSSCMALGIWCLLTSSGFSLFVCCFVFLKQGFSVYPWLSWNSLSRPNWPQTHRDLPAAASQLLRLKACATTARLIRVLMYETESWKGIHCPEDTPYRGSPMKGSRASLYLPQHSSQPRRPPTVLGERPLQLGKAQIGTHDPGALALGSREG